jgi:hypothetical protein
LLQWRDVYQGGGECHLEGDAPQQQRVGQQADLAQRRRLRPLRERGADLTRDDPAGQREDQERHDLRDGVGAE